MGCSNPHPNGQIWAQSSLPSEPPKKDLNQRLWLEKHGTNLLLEYAELEQEKKERIVGQMIVAAGIKDNALLIDCRDQGLKQGPLPEGASVVIMDTSTRRGLVDSAYNERREQCENAAKFCEADIPRDVSLKTIMSEDRPDELTYKRAKHVLLENDRTVKLTSRDFCTYR